jgi:hypothetical protein
MGDLTLPKRRLLMNKVKQHPKKNAQCGNQGSEVRGHFFRNVEKPGFVKFS